ncbi:MAG: DUF58 domain-containing protein [Verrucomicrobia bacterium]|nr:DUF58 domain-containing protein [Verrucomicrobiota bacterium]
MTDAEARTAVQRGAHTAAARWRLPFSRQAWRGLSGNWLGAGSGSSLDFQDHRTYVPGDDPRHIHWQAFARTGALTMKLYRAEVAPFVDLAVDVSASMALTPAKRARTDELVALCVECADRAGAPVRLQTVVGRALRSVSADEVRAGRWRERLPAVAAGEAVVPGPIPWRPGAMKVLISDLLFPGEPSSLLVSLAGGSGVGVVLAPALAEEAELPWRGNVELTDCESGVMRTQRVDEPLASRYHAAYERHFALWREASRRRGVLFASVRAEGELVHALAGEAFAAGAVEATA